MLGDLTHARPIGPKCPRDIDEAVAYYTKLFGVEPHKRRPGYANFAIDAPPLKLVLFEDKDATERLNHLGVDMFDHYDVMAAGDHLETQGILKAVSICVSEGAGQVLWRGEVANEAAVVAATLSRRERHLDRAVLETGSCGIDLYRGLEAAGVAVVCVCARHAKGAFEGADQQDRRQRCRGAGATGADRLVQAGLREVSQRPCDPRASAGAA